MEGDERDQLLPQKNSGMDLSERGYTSQQLAKAIFDAELPEEYIKTLPAQSVYMAMQALGLESSGSLLEMLSVQQYQVVLDLELWEKDEFDEERFWSWLALIASTNTLEPLVKFLRTFDRTLIGVMVARYIHAVTLEEASDQAPGVNYYTPDNGYTWVKINIEDQEKHVLLGKLLALLFQTDAKVFYQLLSLSFQTTLGDLEERAYAQKSQRLWAEGVPDHETGWKLNTSLSPAAAETLLREKSRADSGEVTKAIIPVVYEGGVPQPLASLFEELAVSSESLGREQLESGITLIANAGVVFYGIPPHDFEQVRLFLQKVKGAINIGLMQAMALGPCSSAEAYSVLGVRKLYQLGLHQLRDLGRVAAEIPESMIEEKFEDQTTLSTLSACKKPFPELPNFFEKDGSFEEDDELPSGVRAFENPRELEGVREYLLEAFPDFTET